MAHSHHHPPPHPTPENGKTPRKKIQAKAIQRHVPWLNLSTILKILFPHNIASTHPGSDLRARLKTQIPVHSISWGCPKRVRPLYPISLLISMFYIYLDPGCKSHGQIELLLGFFTMLEMSKNKRHFSPIFSRILFN